MIGSSRKKAVKLSFAPWRVTCNISSRSSSNRVSALYLTGPNHSGKAMGLISKPPIPALLVTSSSLKIYAFNERCLCFTCQMDLVFQFSQGFHPGGVRRAILVDGGAVIKHQRAKWAFCSSTVNPLCPTSSMSGSFQKPFPALSAFSLFWSGRYN